ncbi:MAG TPA: DinB family protein [Chloroflexota bacterium]|nr:DinB family protein [Chloroflexota bacterium]HUM71243.1 DinB family protein [Chloroflexota bacterium]
MTDAKKDEIVAELNETRTALLEYLRGLQAEEWDTAVQSEDARWTVADIARHIASAEKGMIGLIEQFQQGNDPVPPDFDLARYNQRNVQKSQELTPVDLLTALNDNHTRLLQVIDGLAPEDWQKKGRHGSMRILTIAEVCRVIAAHDLTHLADIQKALSG